MQANTNLYHHVQIIQDISSLLSVPEEEPVTVAWVSNSGEDLTVVTFPGIENKMLGLAFTISTDGSYMFFVDALEGKLYRTGIGKLVCTRRWY